MKMRRGEVHIEEGYDGEFGKIFIPEGGSAASQEQGSLLPENPGKKKKAAGKKKGSVKKKADAAAASDDDFTAALLDTDNHMCVIAGPGTGKTYSLVERIERLVRKGGVAPARITALAFTNKAALELAERLARRGIVAGAFTGTIHSLCMEIIASASPGDRRPAVMSDAELSLLLGCVASRIDVGIVLMLLWIQPDARAVGGRQFDPRLVLRPIDEFGPDADMDRISRLAVVLVDHKRDILTR